MANLSNINNILRVSSSGVGINKNNTGPSELDIESAGADMIDMTRTNLKTYRLAISGASDFSIFDVVANSDRLTISSSGNLGVGGSPVLKLEVQGTASSPTPFGSAAVNGVVRIASGGTNPMLDIGSNSAAPYEMWLQAHVPANTYGTPISLQPLGGNVGIGTNSPDEKLSVDGNIFLQGNDDYIAFNTSASSGHPKIKMNNDADFSFLNTAGSNLLHIENGGNVGIGTTGPLNKLTVLASNTGTQITTIPVGKFINTGNSFSKLIVGSDNANFDGVFSMDNNSTLADTKLRIYIGNGTNATTGHSNDHIVLQGNGNVGIGTTDPDEKLVLYKAINYASDSALYSAYAVNSTAVDNNKVFKWRTGITGNQTGHNLTFSTLARTESSYVERMRITSGGGVECYDYLKADRFYSYNGNFSTTSGTYTNVIELQQSEFENRTVLCNVYTNGTHSYASATVNCAWNGGSFVLTMGNKIVGGSTDLRVSGGYLQFYTPWTSSTNFYRLTVN